MRQPKQAKFAPKLNIAKLTNNSFSIRKLLNQANSRISLTDLVNDSVSALFKRKFQVNSLENHQLTLTCQSASLMTRFRFSEEDVKKQLNQRIKPDYVDKIEIKIRPKIFNQDHQKNILENNNTEYFNSQVSSQIKLSKKNAQLLLEEAEHTEDQKLKTALLRLANNHCK